jgi:hypothetical protein
MSEFKKGYIDTLKNMGGIQGTFEGDLYSEQVQKSINDAMNALQNEAIRNQNIDEKFLKGWLAEQWHAETLKTNAKARGRDDIWATVSGNNRTGEDINYGDSEISKTAEVKYNQDAHSTARGISRSEYSHGEKVVPGDQIDEIPMAALKRAETIISNPKNAEQLKDVKQLEDTAARAKDHIEVDGVPSKPLDNAQAKKMAEDFKKDGRIEADKYGLNSENFVKWSDVARQAGEAALTAAALSAALSAAPHIWATLKEYIETDKIDLNVLAGRGASILESSAAAGFRGGVAAALTVACKTGLMGDALKSISPTAIGIATTMTINVIGYSLKLQRGIISQQEFTNYCIKDTFILSSAIGGAAIGQMIIPIPMLGALIGNLVGATLGAFAYEGVNEVILGLSVENGWTFFGLVEQNYTVPEDILKQCGYETFSVNSFQLKTFKVNSFNLQSFTTNSLSFTPIRRGVISSNVVGYV